MMTRDYKVVIIKTNPDKLENLLNQGWEIQRSDQQMVAMRGTYNQVEDGGVIYILSKPKR